MFCNNKNKDKKQDINNNGCSGCYDTFTESIEEEIRQENWQRLWNRYGKYIVSIVVCVIVVSSVYTMWQKQDMEDREAISSKFILVQNAIINNNIDAYITHLKELSNIDKNEYSVLSKLEYAAILHREGKPESLDIYKSIFMSKNVDKILKDLSYIQYVSASLDLMKPDVLLKNIDAMIKDLSEKYLNGPWKLLACETLSFCYIKLGSNDLAIKYLSEIIKDEKSSQDMKERAKLLVQNIS